MISSHAAKLSGFALLYPTYGLVFYSFSSMKRAVGSGLYR